MLSKQILSRTPRELQNFERSVFMKEVSTQNLWSFELATQEGLNFPIWIKIGFQQRDMQDSQNINNDTFYRRPVKFAQSFNLTEKKPDSAILIKYDDDDYSQGYGQIKETFSALTKHDLLNPYITDHDFRSSNEGNDTGYNFYVLHIRYQKKPRICSTN